MSAFEAGRGRAGPSEQRSSGRSFRILMYSSYFPPEYSGAALQAISLARELRRRGHHIEFVTQRWPGLAAVDEHDGFPVTRLEAGRGAKHKELRLWWNLARHVWRRRKEVDFLHSHGAYYTHSFLGPLARIHGLRSLAKASLADNDLHGIGTGLTGKLHQRMLARIDACIAISRDLETEFLAAGIPRERVWFLPNGVDAVRFRPAAQEEKRVLRRRLGLPVDRPVALYVGVFDRRKNIEWLMKSWPLVIDASPRPLLLAVGPVSRKDEGGRFKARLAAYAEEHEDVLRVGDHIDDVTDLYRAADLFVLPSLGEGLPNALLEAMSCGLTCLAANVSGTRELIRDQETGFLFEVGDDEGLCHAVAAALAPSGRGAGAAARSLIEESYSLKHLAQRYEELYAHLLEGTVDAGNRGGWS